MEKSYHVEEDTIVINRELNDLDLFLKDFLEILKRHSDYLVVSGFVSISAGRARGTEDIDVLFPILGESKFKELFEDLINNGFWCYQADYYQEAYKYVEDYYNIRFAKSDEIFPNIEFVPIDKTRKAKYFEFNHPQKIRIKNFEFKIPPIEFEILYKEIILKGKKDIADAKHLRTFFSDIIDDDKLIKYKEIIESELKNEDRN